MSQVRPPISQSLSLPATSSSSLAPRAPKRRLASTSELEFFKPAASSFNPRPYAPHIASPSDSFSKPTNLVRNHGRAPEPHVLPPAGMDPQLTDPNVIFVHPPFTTFPNSHLYPDGLSYQLMADNPEWFLDADDFISQHNPNIHAIPYPPHLEPPRGWCPAKKKDLRDRGSEGWPEGEEPRLRCTFCRRTYAGVNAKSMWRRHVFEKHKIAMSNRRDGSERPRGRGSNKENKQVSSKPHTHSHDSLVSLSVTPHTEPRNISHKSKFRSLLPIPPEVHRQRRNSMRDKSDFIPPLLSRATQEGPPTVVENGSARRYPLSRPHNPPLSPPLTPHASSSSDNPLIESESSTLSTSPTPVLSTVPPSPYDPLLTPSFRHSPPRLPSDQPWRFPSPSHPLHSRSRELSLSMLIRNMESPNLKSFPDIGESPRPLQASPIPSPHSFSSNRPKRSILDLDTPESMAKLPRPSPRSLFTRGRISLPAGYHSPHKQSRYRIEESPLRRTLGTMAKTLKLSSSELTDDWLSAPSLSTSSSSLDTLELLASTDPFVSMYPPWGTIESGQTDTQANPSSPNTSPEVESPVLRNSTLPMGVGLGIGLLGPFTLPDDELVRAGDDSDFNKILRYPLLTDEGDEAEVATFLADRGKKGVENISRTTPPLKKRRLTID